MSIAEKAVENRTVVYFAVFLVAVAGIASFFSLGQLEDPEFSVKTAVVLTTYPGASPEQVEKEVTDRIELAIQEMKEVKYIESFSRAGLSQVKVEIKAEYWSDELPQVWDMLRRKIRDVEGSLPPGAGRPIVGDDYGDVFGFQLVVTGEGFNYAEMERYAKDIKRQLSQVDGVARVDLWGTQDKVIYVDVSQTQLSELGLSDEHIAATLKQQNLVVNAGGVDHQDKRYRIAPTGEFQSPEDIGDLVIRPLLETGGGEAAPGRSSELIRIRDIGTVSRGYAQPPRTMMRYNGRPSVGISITNVSGVNIVDVGRAIDQRLEELNADLPVGVEVRRVHWQSDVVAEAVNGFIINFAEAVAIVLIVLVIPMGWRMGVVIGSALVLTILGSFVLMAGLGIDLQRMSLGALVIALGMMVDNAIVVADGIAVRLQRGMDRRKAAIEAATQPSLPLLGATVVAVMAFYPIFASIEGAGEYCRTLFTVVAISLLISWLISVTVTPLLCIDILKAPKGNKDGKDPFDTKFYGAFRKLLRVAIRFRLITVAGMVALLVLSVVGFTQVDQLFFPDSSMKKLMVDYWAPEGTRIQQVESDLQEAETWLLADERVESVGIFIGSGPPRFYLPVEPEAPYPSYAQLIVNVHDLGKIDEVIADLNAYFADNYPNALVPIRKYGVGPSKTWKFDLRIIGPDDADPKTLRAAARQITDILNADPLCAYSRTNWRQRVQKIVPEYNQERARWAGVSPGDIGKATRRAFDGRPIGTYREQDDLIPIVLRHVAEERQNVAGLDVLQVQPGISTGTVPLSQVTDGVDIPWEDPLIWRRGRRRFIAVQANPILGATFPALRASVLPRIEKVKLPPGYTMEWGGEYESTQDSQASLLPGVIPAVAVMAMIVVALFNAFRSPLVIVLTIPFALIGVTIGLLVTGTPFGFLALLGAMSLVGMMIKNAIVLLDQIKLERSEGKDAYDAVVISAVSRLRPVVLAAATTVLGVAPLLQDVFWVGLAVAIMAGLTFGTILTMVMVPVFYAVVFRVKVKEGSSLGLDL